MKRGNEKERGAGEKELEATISFRKRRVHCML